MRRSQCLEVAVSAPTEGTKERRNTRQVVHLPAIALARLIETSARATRAASDWILTVVQFALVSCPFFSVCVCVCPLFLLHRYSSRRAVIDHFPSRLLAALLHRQRTQRNSRCRYRCHHGCLPP